MIKPLEDRVIIKLEKEQEEKTASGLILTALASSKDNQGIVVAVGEGRLLPNGERVEMDVKVGDKIVFNPLATQFIDYQGEEYQVIYTKDVLAIIEEN